MKYNNIAELVQKADKTHPIFNIEKITTEGKNNSEWLFDHVKDIMEIFQDSLEYLNKANIVSKNEIKFYIHNTGRDVNIIAYTNEHPVGVLQLEKKKLVYVIQNVYVLKEHRRQGIATSLYDLAHDKFNVKSSLSYTSKGLNFILKYYANSTIKDLRILQEKMLNEKNKTSNKI